MIKVIQKNYAGPRFGVAALLLTIFWVEGCPNFAMGSSLMPTGTAKHEGSHPTEARYCTIVDVLFPRKLLGANPSEILLTARYLPASEGESQIVLSKKLDGGYAVTYYSLRAGRQRIADQLDHIGRSGVEDVVEIAKRIEINIRSVDVPSSVLSDLLNRFAKLRVSPRLPTQIVLDATRYQLWFRIAYSKDEFFISFEDADYGHDQKAHPLVRWMNELKRVVEKYASAG